MPAPSFAFTIPLAPLEAFVLILTRVLAALAASPVLGARTIPALAKLGLGAFLSMILVPVVVTAGSATPTLTWEALGSEALTGALAGFAATVIFTAVQFGAALLDVQAGFSLGATYDATLGDAGAVLGRFSNALATLLFFELNGHHLLLRAVRELFILVPLGGFSDAFLRPSWWAELVAGMFRVGIQMVLPVLAALLAADMALALLVRVAPQFNLFVVGMPLKVAVVLLGMGLALPFIVDRVDTILRLAAVMPVQVFR